MFQDEDFKEPENKIDLFKAIFLDTDDSDTEQIPRVFIKSTDDKKEELTASLPDKSNEAVNVLRNTSPPRGIFANLDLDKLSARNKNIGDNRNENVKSTALPTTVFESEKSGIETGDTKSDNSVPLPENCYGPSLPAVPADRPKTSIILQLDVNDDKWVEKPLKDGHRRKAKSHHKKKHKKEKKKEKHKKKKSKRRSSDSDSD